MKNHQKVYKLVSNFLHYPEKEWLEMMPEIKEEIQTIEQPAIRAYITSFLHYIESTPFELLCELYVKTFDFHGIATLNLTYNVFKDSKKRGEALIHLRKIFYHSNLVAKSDELPDFLPLILEFLSVAQDEDMYQLLKIHINSISNLNNVLTENDSPYHFLLKATTEISYEMMKKLKVS